MLSVAQPFERIPIWHKQGSAIITTPNPGVRTDLQDWQQLSVHVYAGDADFEVVKLLVSRNETSASHEVHVAQRDGSLTVQLRELSSKPREVASWHLRVQRSDAAALSMDGNRTIVRAKNAQCDDLSVFPFGKVGAFAPCHATVHEAVVTTDVLLQGVRVFVQ
jgi:hypothetical protein